MNSLSTEPPFGEGNEVFTCLQDDKTPLDPDVVPQALGPLKGPRHIEAFLDTEFGYDCDLWWMSMGLWTNLQASGDREPWFVRPPTRPSGPPGWKKWALDVPNVPTLDYHRLRAMQSKSDMSKADMCQAIDWCSDLKSFESLIRPNWRFLATKSRSTDFEASVDQLLRDGYTSPISRRQIKCAIKGFAVPKIKKKTRRAILDARPVNEGMKEVPHVRLPTQSDIDECVRDYKYFVELDGKGWFHQFGLGEGIPAYFTMKFGAKTFQWNRMPMGWSYSVWIAQKTTEFLADFLLPNGVRIIVYVDNVYVFGSDEKNIGLAVETFLDRCRQVSAQFSITTPLTSTGVVLGMEVDLIRKTVKLPVDFVNKIQMAKNNLSGLFDDSRGRGSGSNSSSYQSVHTRLLWKLFGCLHWGARVLQTHMYRYPRWSAWLSHRARQLHDNPTLWDRGCRIWPKALRDLRQLCTDICANPERTVKNNSANSHTVFTDASDVGYGVCHHRKGRTFGRRWTTGMTRHTIALRELYASVEGIKDTVVSYPDSEHVHLVGDNTNVIAWIKKKKAPTFFGNRLLQDLFTALGHRTLTTEWIPSADNPADEPSRSPWKYGDGMSGPDSDVTGVPSPELRKTSSTARHVSNDVGRFTGEEAILS